MPDNPDFAANLGTAIDRAKEIPVYSDFNRRGVQIGGDVACVYPVRGRADLFCALR